MTAIADTLPIFDGFSQEEIAYFLLMSQTQYRKPGEVILTVGEASNGCAYFVKSWLLKVIRGGNEIAFLSEGSFFGETALIMDEPRTATVEVVDDTELQVFLKDEFLILLNRSEHSREFKEEIIRRMRENVQR
jgi:CRP/FNR family transcriptional regulator, cyclic AMP receptor protein